MSHGNAGSAFTARDRRRLARALATAPLARVYRRLEAVLLVAEGHPPSDAARRVRVDRASVHRWVARYRQRRDVAALADGPRPGRPPTARQLTPRLVALTLGRDPRELGLCATTWTVPLLARCVGWQLGCPVTPRTLRRRLHALGYRWKRPRYVYTGRPGHQQLARKKGRCAGA
ncbi:MAG TPA: helix-turn-helix domain-containing protein [Thermodesulfobacteriota bacterium]